MTAGFEWVFIAGISPDAEPSSRDLAAVTEVVRESGVSAIYTETPHSMQANINEVTAGQSCA